MAYKDMRDWIAHLEKEGQLLRVKAKVDWDEELGTIVRRVFNTRGPALLFENIKGYETGRCTKLFTAALHMKDRLCMMLDIPKETKFSGVVQEMRKRLRNPISPVVVSTGPCKENIVKGDDVNLFDFPVPHWHRRDGGRYISTWDAVVTRDPETKHLNAGLYRGMIHDRNHFGTNIVFAQHWGIHFQKYRRLGKPMPFAVAIGLDPVAAPLCAAPVQHYPRSEYDYMGGLRGEAVELVKCETNDLLVPANSEIVLEGYVDIDPAGYKAEGPFGEYTGYFGERLVRPVLTVTCITHRNDPIFRGTLEGQDPGGVYTPSQPIEDSRVISALDSAIVWNMLDDVGIPGVLDLTVGATTVVRINKLYRGHAKQLATALWGNGASVYLHKHVIVVDDDIDIRNWRSIEWALSYRVNAAENDVLIFPGTPGSPLDPAIRYEQRNDALYGVGFWARVLIDATKNFDYPPVPEWDGNIYPPVASTVEPETYKKVVDRWLEYGFKSQPVRPPRKGSGDE